MATTADPLPLLGHQQAKIARLELAVGALSLSVLLLVSIGAWYAIHGVPIHFIPPGGPGLSQPGVIPDGAATEFASRWLKARYTFTPATVKIAHVEVLTALHPSLSVAFKAQAEREAALVKEAHLSTQVAVESANVLSHVGHEVVVQLQARRTVWIGGHQVRDEALTAQLTIVPWEGHGAPIGLLVANVGITPALSVTGP